MLHKEKETLLPPLKVYVILEHCLQEKKPADGTYQGG